MRLILIFVAMATAVLVTLSSATPAMAQSEQGEARRDREAGNVMPLRDIERIVLPTMGGAQYLGPAYDSAAMVYRLKFIKDGRVLFVDVDARTGKILYRSN